MLKSRIPASALFLLTSLLSFGQDYYFKHVKVEDGLPNNTIFSCSQDKNGFIWIGTKDGLCRFDGHQVRIFEGGYANGRGIAILEDSEGKIWIPTSGGMGCYDPETDELKDAYSTAGTIYNLCEDKRGDIWANTDLQIVRYNKITQETDLYDFKVQQMTQGGLADYKGQIWFSSADGCILKYNQAGDTFDRIEVLGEADKAGGVYPTNIIEGRPGKILIATNTGRLLRFDTVTGNVETLLKDSRNLTINCLLHTSNGNCFVGCLQGLYMYSDFRGFSKVATKSDPHGLSNDNVTCMTEDREGNLWVGTYHGGINMCRNSRNRISQFYSGGPNSITGDIVRTINADTDGNIWVGTEDGGLCRFVLRKRTVEDIAGPNNLKEQNWHSSLLVDGKMWVSTFGNGIYIFDASSGRLTGHKNLPDNRCVYLYKTREGVIYVCTGHGLYQYDSAADSFSPAGNLADVFAHAMCQDSDGTLWVGTFGQGLWYRKMNESAFTRVPDIQSDPKGFQAGIVTSLFEDSNKRLWIATEGHGVCYKDIEKDDGFTSITRAERLPSNIASAVAEDIHGNIWVSTTKGLAQLNPKTARIENIHLDNDNIVGNSYCYSSSYVSPEGRLHFGTFNGMISFNPDQLVDPVVNAPVFITEILSGEGPRATELRSKGKSALSSDIIKVKKRDLSLLTISFAAPCYSNIRTVLYEYNFRHHRKEQRSITSQNQVTYTDLDSGTYTFTVRVLGSQSPNAEKKLILKVIPPVYQSTAAILFYIFAILAMLGTLFVLSRKRFQNQEALQRSEIEAAKQREIYEAKINFFTNITHEIRTPLSLIRMPIEKIIAEKEYTEASKEDILTIEANTSRLLNLVNQLLDIRKIEKREVTPNNSVFDICKLVRKISDYFTPAIKERHIEYTSDIQLRSLSVVSDPDYIEKVLCNLLSNAVKYCENWISLKLEYRKGENRVLVRVSSNGDKITGQDAEKIFEPFYQIRTVNSSLIGSNGTGLGLPYARNLANILGGKLYLETGTNSGYNTFVFELPVTQAAEESEPVAAEPVEENAKNFDTNKHSILVVEDSPEMREYLCKELGKEYNIIDAGNGEEALALMESKKIDLVISDIMMPVMDGCQLCNNIKMNLEYSHIPVILLTAAVGVETRIETLEVGADGYIEKPFSIELLRANISNLFKNREIAYNQFANSPLTHFNSTVVNNIDKEFMDKLHDVVMENISDQSLDIEMLTSLMLTSKSTLYRKVKANIGVNINEYIRICRLKKAAELLASQQYRINEVAYMTGFSSPSYFATSFQKQFQISPSNFVKNLTK